MNKERTWICDKCNDTICKVSRQYKKGFPDDPTPLSLVRKGLCLAPLYKYAQWKLMEEPEPDKEKEKEVKEEIVYKYAKEMYMEFCPDHWNWDDVEHKCKEFINRLFQGYDSISVPVKEPEPDKEKELEGAYDKISKGDETWDDGDMDCHNCEGPPINNRMWWEEGTYEYPDEGKLLCDACAYHKIHEYDDFDAEAFQKISDSIWQRQWKRYRVLKTMWRSKGHLYRIYY